MKEEINQVKRANIAWNILTEVAINRDLITYGELGHQMQVHHRAIRFFLDLIQTHCLNNDLPPLTILIVNQTGKPGEGYIASNIENFDLDKDLVYSFDWTKIANPFGEEEKNNSKFTGYWTFFCNPSKWEIDKFLMTETEYDGYQVTPWQQKAFSEGQLGVIRVSTDKRTKAELNGRPKLEAGIYAIVEITSKSYQRTDKPDEFWTDWNEKENEKPIVNIRYIKNLINSPILIKDLKKEQEIELDKYLLNGFQASSMPLNKNTFEFIIEKIGNIDIILNNIEIEETPKSLSDLEKLEEKYRNATPEVIYRISRTIERGTISQKIKEYNNYKCQICESLGLSPYSFKKKSGEFYVETHHIIPVSESKKGSLGLANLITVCANHHRQIHFGNIGLIILEDKFILEIDDKIIEIKKINLSLSLKN
jgi:predicted HNH restriction endonuclease